MSLPVRSRSDPTTGCRTFRDVRVDLDASRHGSFMSYIHVLQSVSGSCPAVLHEADPADRRMNPPYNSSTNRQIGIM